MACVCVQVDAEEYFDDQREVEYFCFNQQYHRAPKQVSLPPLLQGGLTARPLGSSICRRAPDVVEWCKRRGSCQPFFAMLLIFDQSGGVCACVQRVLAQGKSVVVELMMAGPGGGEAHHHWLLPGCGCQHGRGGSGGSGRQLAGHTAPEPPPGALGGHWRSPMIRVDLIEMHL